MAAVGVDEHVEQQVAYLEDRGGHVQRQADVAIPALEPGPIGRVDAPDTIRAAGVVVLQEEVAGREGELFDGGGVAGPRGAEQHVARASLYDNPLPGGDVLAAIRI